MGDPPTDANTPFTIDELRISRVARSDEWIAATYANQSAPERFSIAGALQELP